MSTVQLQIYTQHRGSQSFQTSDKPAKYSNESRAHWNQDQHVTPQHSKVKTGLLSTMTDLPPDSTPQVATRVVRVLTTLPNEFHVWHCLTKPAEDWVIVTISGQQKPLCPQDQQTANPRPCFCKHIWWQQVTANIVGKHPSGTREQPVRQSFHWIKPHTVVLQVSLQCSEWYSPKINPDYGESDLKCVWLTSAVWTSCSTKKGCTNMNNVTVSHRYIPKAPLQFPVNTTQLSPGSHRYNHQLQKKKKKHTVYTYINLRLSLYRQLCNAS